MIMQALSPNSPGPRSLSLHYPSSVPNIIGPVRAQTPTSVITGSVLDQSGAVIPEASVTLTNTGTGATRSAKTNNVGLYDFPALTPGHLQSKD
jgi:hypothetical protein